VDVAVIGNDLAADYCAFRLVISGYSVARFGGPNYGGAHPVATCLSLMPPGHVLDIASAGRLLLKEYLLGKEPDADAVEIYPIFAGHGESSGCPRSAPLRSSHVVSEHLVDLGGIPSHSHSPEIVFDQSLLLRSLRAASSGAIHLSGEVATVQIEPGKVCLLSGSEHVIADKLLISSGASGAALPGEFALDLLAGREVDQTLSLAAEYYSALRLVPGPRRFSDRAKQLITGQLIASNELVDQEVYCCRDRSYGNLVWLRSIGDPAFSVRFAELAANLLISERRDQSAEFVYQNRPSLPILNGAGFDSATIPWPA